MKLAIILFVSAYLGWTVFTVIDWYRNSGQWGADDGWNGPGRE